MGAKMSFSNEFIYSLITSLGGTDYKDIFVHFSKTTERIFKILFANPPVMLGNTGRHTGDITLWILSTVAFFVNTCYVVAHYVAMWWPT